MQKTNKYQEIKSTSSFSPCCLCGKKGIKRFSLTVGKGNHQQKKFVCEHCRKKPNFRYEVEQKFFCLMPIKTKETLNENKELDITTTKH
jgi:hypothetical protein